MGPIAGCHPVRYFDIDWECFVMHIELTQLDCQKTCQEQSLCLVDQILERRAAEQKSDL